MPALPIPPFMKLLSVGATFGGFATGPDDYLAEGLSWGLRGGARVPDTPVEIEATLTWSEGLTRTGGYKENSSYNHLDLLGLVVDGHAVDVVAGGGVGWRSVRLDEGYVGVQTPKELLGFRANPALDFIALASVGVRARVWGPLSLRLDVQGGVSMGEEPADSPIHVWPVGLAALGLDVRWQPPPDRDRDGVGDKDDRCPDSLEDLDYFDDKDGCLDPDDDNDRILDVNDQCKGQAEDLDGYKDADGCLDHNDDGDAYPDVDDRCPRDAESENAWEDGDGCPDALPDELAALLGKQPLVTFTPEGALTPESAPRLAELAAVVLRYPAIVVQIRVATDSGPDSAHAYARTLTQAKAIYAALAALGVGGDRIAMVSAGDSGANPIAATEAARALDRFVEFSLIDTIGADGKPIPFTPVPPERW